jgi:30S ribosomal protein S31
MGKGDKKSKRGKIFMGSFGKTRPHSVSKATSETVKEEKTQTKSA